MAKKTYPSGVITPELGSTNWYSDYDTNSSLLDSNITKTNSLDSKVKELETSYTNVETSLTSLSAVAKSGDYNDLSNKPESIALAEKAVADGDNNVITKTYATKKEVVTSLEPYIKKTELADVATSGSYTDLSNKPTIPTVNNATLTIQKNGTTVKTFTANSSTNVTANITVPTKTSELTNNSGFLTSHSPVDSSLSSTSTNAIQNKVVNDALKNKANNSEVVHKSGDETISGVKKFKNTIFAEVGGAPVLKVADGSEFYILKKDNATLPGGIILRSYKADNTYIDLKCLNNGTFTWNNANILTDANQIMLAKNLSGTTIAPGGVVDCGNGNGKLKQWYLLDSGVFALASSPKGVWKNAGFLSMAPNLGSIFIKIG